MGQDINSVHIEYIKNTLDKVDKKLDSHISDEMHDFRSVRNDVNQIQVDMAAMREKHKELSNFRTGVVAVFGAGLALMFETMARKFFP